MTNTDYSHQQQNLVLSKRLQELGENVCAPKLQVAGKLVRMVGLTLEAIGCQAPIGARCLIQSPHGDDIEAEVVGFSGEKLFLMPIGNVQGVHPNAKVIPMDHVFDVPVGKHLLGRVINGKGEPIDQLGDMPTDARVPLNGRAINPLSRDPINSILNVGVRAINALFSVGRGQRMGLFAGSGVGKSILLGMMTKYTSADVIVVGLIGERGREVKEFIQNILGKEGMKRSVVVACPADETPLMRLNGAALATSVAEYFRDQGLDVLLLMDSLTRYAQAQREIALAIGEPPATKGYPPSVFTKIPQLVERAGNGDKGEGSITAFYTVLTEGDDTNDPIADSARAILDGHIVLSRELAESGHYPAIDVEASISRAMTEIVTENQLNNALQFKRLYSSYRQNQDLINIGAYQPGSNPNVDDAIKMFPYLSRFLQQSMNEAINMAESDAQLTQLLAHKNEINKQISPLDNQMPALENSGTIINNNITGS